MISFLFNLAFDQPPRSNRADNREARGKECDVAKSRDKGVCDRLTDSRLIIGFYVFGNFQIYEVGRFGEYL